MKAYWEQLAQRERRFLIGGSVALVVMALYLFAWEPVASGRELLTQKVPQQRELLAWMEQSAEQIIQLRESGGSAKQGFKGSLLGVVDRSAKADKVASAVKRMDPQGDKSVRVTLENVSFNNVIRWLGNLESQYGISTKSITLERAEKPGLVSVRVTLDS